MSTPERRGDRGAMSAVAHCIGERIDARVAREFEEISRAPICVRAGRAGLAAIFRYGAVVCLDLDAGEQAALLERIRPYVARPFEHPEGDEAEILFRPDTSRVISAEGSVVLPDSRLDRLLVVCHVLAKSALLAHYEREISVRLDQIEPLAEKIRERGRSGIRDRRVLRQIGDALLTQLRTVGRAEVLEQPEMTWDKPELARLYAQLGEEYELRDRSAILDRKLDVMGRTAETLLDLLYTRRSYRVEWYIVLLILIEIVLGLYDMFVRGR